MKSSESTQSTIRRDFAQNLKHYLSEKGMTQLELSRRVNVAPASVSDWVRAKASYSLALTAYQRSACL